jgi:uncharacterized RDD family membrane protein YckC
METMGGTSPQLDLAGRWMRLGTSILDGLILGLPIALGSSASGSGDAGVALAAVGGLVTLALAVVQIWLLTRDGQTIAMKLTAIRIVKHDTGLNGGFVPNVLMRGLVNGLLGIIPFYGLVDALFIFRDDRRCVHDLIAGTSVVRAIPNRI